MLMTSRHRACCIRLAMKPGTSFLQRTGSFPTPASTSMTVCAVSSEVASDFTTSTRGIRWPGFQKWVPTKRSRLQRSRLMRLGLMTEELVQKMVSSRQRSSSMAKVERFTSISSNTASTTRSALESRGLALSVVKEMRLRRSSSSSVVRTPFSTSSAVFWRMPAATSTSFMS